MIPSSATTPGQSGPGSNGNEVVRHIPQNYKITGALLWDCLMPFQGHSLWGSYSSTDMQSMYSTAAADRAGEAKSIPSLPFALNTQGKSQWLIA